MSAARGTAETARILVVESDPVHRRVLSSGLGAAFARPVDVRFAERAADALALLRAEGFELVVVDVATIGEIDRIADFGRMSPTAVVLAMTNSGTVSGAIAALRAGADDFLVKPFPADRIHERYSSCRNRRRTASSESTSRPHRLLSNGDFEGFIGASAAMRGVYDQITRIAASRAPVFITGESGTGKELCAQAVHARSQRADGPFIAINCSAIPKDLMESEIFGHVRGAFTGATDDRPGAAELADGGTLFLDEIGEMDLSLQVKLLRFVQTGTVRHVGGTTARAVDVRFVCATNRDPWTEIESGRFREDLFYRLHVLPIELPPLRNRSDDILVLARCFLERFAKEENKAFAGFDAAAEARLLAGAWPGNVRQLENVIRQIVVFFDGDTVRSDMLPPILGEAIENKRQTSNFPTSRRARSTSIVPFWRQERNIIEQALATFDGNISRAAAALEIAPSTIYRKRQSWASRGAS